MKAKIKVEVNIDIDGKYCNPRCQYEHDSAPGFKPWCRLFLKELKESNEEYDYKLRCSQCKKAVKGITND